MKSTNKYDPLPSLNHWIPTALLLFLLASLYGVLMRASWLVDISWLDYRHLLHAHSHLAMLGWGFTVLSGAFILLLVRKTSYRRFYRQILLANIIASIGMAIFFTYQGYGPLSIGFCSIHLVSAYLFSYCILQDLRKCGTDSSVSLARWSIYWMLISTIGLLSLGPVSILLGKTNPLYYACIQFFLHFQFNGWFTYAILSLLIRHFYPQGLKLSPWLTNTLHISLISTYALSITWSTPKDYLFYLNSIGVILQTFTIGFILYILIRQRAFSMLGNSSRWLLISGICCLGLKVLVQSAVAIPFIAEISYTIRNFVVGFIHLVMLGSVSLTLLALLADHGYAPGNYRARVGYIILIVAFLLSELILFAQGLMFWFELGFMPYYYELIFAFTLLFPIALGFILMGFQRLSPVQINKTYPGTKAKPEVRIEHKTYHSK